MITFPDNKLLKLTDLCRSNIYSRVGVSCLIMRIQRESDAASRAQGRFSTEGNFDTRVMKTVACGPSA